MIPHSIPHKYYISNIITSTCVCVHARTHAREASDE